MIVEPPMLIVGDNEKRFVPFGAVHNGIHHLPYETLSSGNIGRWSIVIVVAVWLINEVGINEGDGGQAPGGDIGHEIGRVKPGINDIVVVIEGVTLEHAQKAVSVFIVTPGDPVLGEMVENRSGEDRLESVIMRIVCLRQSKGIAVEPAGQGVEPVGKGRARMGSEPALADQKCFSQRVMHGHVYGLVVSHDLARIDAFIMFGEIGHEAIKLAPVYLMLHTFVAMAGAFVKRPLGERDRQVVASLVAILLTTVQAVHIGSPAVPAKVAEHVVERAVLHHEHHNVVDVG